jgi:energy-coupling factor transporter ATP-binding protein EcfA2
MLKLRRLRIEKFRNLAKGAELSFADGINIVLGQNGTGKTTLLELISMVVRSDFSSLAKEEFAIEYELAVDDVAVSVVLRNRALVASQDMLEESWRPGMDARIVSQETTTVMRVDSGRLSVNGAPVDAPEMGHILSRGMMAALLGVHGLRTVLVPLMSSAETVRFDESLDVFRAMMAPVRSLGIMPVHRDPTPAFIPHKPLRIPRSMLRVLESLYKADPAAPRFSFTERDLEFLASVAKIMGFATAEAELDVVGRRSGPGPWDYVDLGNLTFRFQFAKGGVDMISHDRLSYGQKRLLTFFCYLDMCPDVVVADELVNGLHHAWISASIQAIGERQAFLTSQNPILLDHVPITSAQHARQSFVLCRSEARRGPSAWFWENMTDADADELFRAYEVGVEHVSEILQSRGLW